jgi:hypothetical protein
VALDNLPGLLFQLGIIDDAGLKLDVGDKIGCGDPGAILLECGDRKLLALKIRPCPRIAGFQLLQRIVIDTAGLVEVRSTNSSWMITPLLLVS